jgi:hypothetical protein
LSFLPEEPLSLAVVIYPSGSLLVAFGGVSDRLTSTGG